MEFGKSLGIQVEEEMKIGSYTGDGTPNRVIDIGFTPKAIWIYPCLPPDDSNAHAVAISGKYASFAPYRNQWEERPMHFKGIVPNGFQTGMDDDGEGTNLLATTYFWIASP